MSNLVAGVGVEPTYEAYETSDWAASLTRNKLVQEAGVEPANGIAELIYSQRPLATWIFHHQANER